jgi:hypothetical protein
VTEPRPLSRRDFLRLRTTERGRVLELSCRALYMRCADADIAPHEPVDYDTLVGEPPAVFSRRSVDDLIAGFQADLDTAQILRLVEPQWLDGMAGADRFHEVVEAFRKRGGRVESQATEGAEGERRGSS